MWTVCTVGQWCACSLVWLNAAAASLRMLRLWKLILWTWTAKIPYASAYTVPEQHAQVTLNDPASDPHTTKSIAIVGGGTAGITTLKTLVADVPEELRAGWNVVLFEQRHGVGGIW